MQEEARPIINSTELSRFINVQVTLFGEITNSTGEMVDIGVQCGPNTIIVHQDTVCIEATTEAKKVVMVVLVHSEREVDLLSYQFVDFSLGCNV